MSTASCFPNGRRLSIGIVCYPTYGGSGVVATELGLGLARLGHKIHFISYSQPARIKGYAANVYYHEVSGAEYPLFEYAPYDTALASKLVEIVIKENLDLLHVHYAIPHATVAYLAKNILKTKNINIPIITTLHGTDITLVGQNPNFQPVVEFGINVSDGITAVSESLKQDTLKNFDITKDIHVVPNFIDLDRFKRQDRDHFKIAIAPGGERIVTHVSNFRPVKRVHEVVEVFNQIIKEVPSKLLLIGDGPVRYSVEELVAKYELRDHVRFLGKQDAIEELLAISDLFLMPSASESFGLAALEAMACKVPVVSSNAGGLPEVNIQGKTGYLAEIGDTETMAKQAIKILKDSDVLDTFSKNAFERAKEFEIDQILPQYETLYERILRQNENMLSA